jgi:hypothetical protein
MEDVRRLTAWRNRFARSFLTEFEATGERTAQWLIKSVGTNPNKILFMIDDLNGSAFGYMGLDFIDWDRGYGEADAIVRGGDAPPGTMTMALHVVVNFARDQLGLSDLSVRVRSDNSALDFYRKAGSREVRRVPLRRVAKLSEVHWIEDPTGVLKEPHLVYMILP